MKTTVDINDALLRELRRQAEETGHPFREIFEQALAIGLDQLARVESRGPVKIKPHRLGLKLGFHRVGLNQLYDQLEAEDSGEIG